MLKVLRSNVVWYWFSHQWFIMCLSSLQPCPFFGKEEQLVFPHLIVLIDYVVFEWQKLCDSSFLLQLHVHGKAHCLKQLDSLCSSWLVMVENMTICKSSACLVCGRMHLYSIHVFFSTFLILSSRVETC